MKKFLIGLFLAITLIYFYTSKTKEDKSVLQGSEMSVPYTVKIGSKLSDEQYKKALQIIKNTFSIVDSKFNANNPDSELSSLNKLKAFAAISISEEMERVLLLTGRAYDLTRGLFDPTIPPALKTWKEKLESGLSSEDADKIRASIGWTKVHFRGRVFYKETNSIQLDLEGIYKGYLVGVLMQNLREEGHQNVYIQWGNIRKARGTDIDGKPWKVSVKGKDIELNKMAFAMSSSSVQKWKVHDCDKEAAFCRILSPLKWKLREETNDSVCKAAVLLPNAYFADAIASTLSLAKNKERAEAFAASMIKEFKDGEFWIYSCDEEKE